MSHDDPPPLPSKRSGAPPAATPAVLTPESPVEAPAPPTGDRESIANWLLARTPAESHDVRKLKDQLAAAILAKADLEVST